MVEVDFVVEESDRVGLAGFGGAGAEYVDCASDDADDATLAGLDGTAGGRRLATGATPFGILPIGCGFKRPSVVDGWLLKLKLLCGAAARGLPVWP